MFPTLNAVTFLIGTYWPFMVMAGLVGVVTGWLSVTRPPGRDA